MSRKHWFEYRWQLPRSASRAEWDAAGDRLIEAVEACFPECHYTFGYGNYNARRNSYGIRANKTKARRLADRLDAYLAIRAELKLNDGWSDDDDDDDGRIGRLRRLRMHHMGERRGGL